MRIALYLDDNGFSGLDLRSPEKGNNGVGGTQYCFLLLAFELINKTKNEVWVYHHNKNILPEGGVSIEVPDWKYMMSHVKNSGCDIFIFKADDKKARIDLMEKYDIKCIAWAHNFLLADKLNQLSASSAIKRVVFVGREHYDRYIDNGVIKKSTFIYNMFVSNEFESRPIPKEKSVTFTGSLVDGKGFHVLAKAWRKVLKLVPDAQLYVIGNGQLYDRNSKLGPLGVSDIAYENKFTKYIMKNGKLLPSVHFLGTLGSEKIQVYSTTKVGVMNPSGITETFGLSAVEMEACAIPVVTKAKNGLFDTVLDGKTGYLINTTDQLATQISVLLQDDALNEKMGKEAKVFVQNSFSPDVILPKWQQTFAEILNNEKPQYIKPQGHFRNNAKWLHIIVRSIRMHGISIPPLAEMDYLVRKMMRR